MGVFHCYVSKDAKSHGEILLSANYSIIGIRMLACSLILLPILLNLIVSKLILIRITGERIVIQSRNSGLIIIFTSPCNIVTMLYYLTGTISTAETDSQKYASLSTIMDQVGCVYTLIEVSIFLTRALK